MVTWKLEVKMSVADSWVADGFDLSDRKQEVEDLLSGMVPFAHGGEVVIKVNVVSAPDRKIVEGLQNGEFVIRD